MKTTLHFSPCPNDTFALYALAYKKVPLKGSWNIEFHDIESLNKMALEEKRGIFKVSSHTYGKLHSHTLLPCGVALTEDAGPILVTSGQTSTDSSTWTVALPGENTTAAWLFFRYGPKVKKVVYERYDKIPEIVAKGRAQAGVLIHEVRFTYQELGLSLHCCLGDFWKTEMQKPLLLAAVVSSKEIEPAVAADFVSDYQASLLWAFKNREQTLDFVKEHSQDKQEKTIQSHIDRFVSQETIFPTPSTLKLFELFRS